MKPLTRICRSARYWCKSLIFAWLATVCFGLGVSFPSQASAQSSREDMVKAAILYNLARFSEWPETRFEDTESNFRICVLSTDALRPALQSLEGKPIKGRAVSLITLDNPQTIDTRCHVFYLSESTAEKIDYGNLADQGILTVGDTQTFIKFGGGIALQRNGVKIGFSISQTTMKRAHIEPSSKILKLAIEVQ